LHCKEDQTQQRSNNTANKKKIGKEQKTTSSLFVYQRVEDSDGAAGVAHVLPHVVHLLGQLQKRGKQPQRKNVNTANKIGGKKAKKIRRINSQSVRPARCEQTPPPGASLAAPTIITISKSVNKSINKSMNKSVNKSPHFSHYHVGDGVEEDDRFDGSRHHLQRPLLHAQHVVKTEQKTQEKSYKNHKTRNK
jgi:hypothetical protein